MDFKIENRHKQNIIKYSKDDLDIAYEFSKEASKELKNLLKAIVLFGSTARKYTAENPSTEKSQDVDIMLVIDDVSIQITEEVAQAYRLIVEKIVFKISKRLHVTSLKFTNFWEYVRAGDPIAINILRDGVALIDTGFFYPLQLLLYEGRIRPSPEAIQNYMGMAPQTLRNSKQHILQATLDLYWAVIDAGHAALMSINEIPPSPSHVGDLMEEKLVKPGLIRKQHAVTMRQFYALGKSIMHGELINISGDQYDAYYREAHNFVMEMKNFIERK